MDRVIVYVSELPRDTDILSTNKNTEVALGAILEAVLGSSGNIVSGFAASQTTVASLTVNIGRGAVTSLQNVENTAYGSLALDTTDQMIKHGIISTTTQFALTPPGTTGQSINYLVSVAFNEQDTGSGVLYYVNAAAPSTPYGGPAGAGTSQNTLRSQQAVLTLTAGAAATTGTQATPATPSGALPLYVITVANGQTAITTAEIVQSPAAPFIPYTVQQLSPGFSNLQTFTTAGTFTVPLGVTKIKVTGVGGGAAGAGTGVTTSTEYGAGAGGSGGAECIGIFEVTPGQQFSVTIGAAGPGVAGASGTNGGNTTFGTLLTAVGGQGGYYQVPAVPPFVCPGSANYIASSGGYWNGTTRAGGNGFAMGTFAVSGKGGDSLLGGGAVGIQGPGGGSFGIPYGTGGSGACVPPNTATPYPGGGGHGGIVFVEY